MRSLGGPLTEEDREKLHELLQDEDLFERMVERAVRGMRKTGRRAR
ncbi:MAG: hypothetical protein LYZ70_06355 [Nitrososphaerales archaeon]|nr:hypothetical protein [Nitrososphaerales archaeon]